MLSRCTIYTEQADGNATTIVVNSGAVGPMFLGGPRAVLFRQTEKFLRQPKTISGRQHFKSSPPPSVDNFDNFRQL
jgi:hypothetical protein